MQAGAAPKDRPRGTYGLESRLPCTPFPEWRDRMTNAATNMRTATTVPVICHAPKPGLDPSPSGSARIEIPNSTTPRTISMRVAAGIRDSPIRREGD